MTFHLQCKCDTIICLLQFHPKPRHLSHICNSPLLTFRSMKEKIQSYSTTDNRSKKWNGLVGFIDFVISSSESFNRHLRWQNTWSTCLGKTVHLMIYVRLSFRKSYVVQSSMSYEANDRNSDENISHFSVNVVPADWLGHLEGLLWWTKDRHLLERQTNRTRHRVELNACCNKLYDWVHFITSVLQRVWIFMMMSSSTAS